MVEGKGKVMSDFATFIAAKHREVEEDPEVSAIAEIPAKRVHQEIQEVNFRLEQLHAERMKLEMRRERLQSRLLEVTDRALEIERARDLASRVSTKAPPKVTYRCRYCARHTRRLYGGLPVCDECRVLTETIAVMESFDDSIEEVGDGSHN